jgi:hypothetical protein
MRSIEYVDWDEVRQVCDRLVRANEGLHAVDSVNFRVGRLRAQLVPDRRSMRLLTDASTAVLRLPIAVTVVEPYPHHIHYLVDGYSIIENRSRPQPEPLEAIHVA